MSQTVDLAQLLSLAQQVTSGKEYFLSTVLARLDDASTALPYDSAVRTAQLVVRKRLEKQGSMATISQRDFQVIYDEVCALGNKSAFRELLGDLLITASPESVANYNSEFTAGRRDSDDILDIADPELVSEFYSIWGGDGSAAANKSVNAGRDGLQFQFASMGFGNPTIDIVGQTEDIVMFAVQADSPIGRFTTYIPSEISQGHVLMPSVFASDKGFSDLTKDNLLAYAMDVFEGRIKVASPNRLFAGLAAVAAQSRPQAVIKTASGENIAIDAPTLYQTVNDYESEVLDMPERMHDLPQPLVSLLSGDIRDALVESGLSHDKNIILTAKSVVSNEMKAAGLRVERITFDSEFEGGLVVSANIVGSGGKKTIQVPIEVTAGQVLMPSVFTSGTAVESFDVQSLRRFASASDVGVFNSAFSNKSGWSYNDLYSYIIKSAAYGNFVEAEDALGVIAEVYGPDFHRAAFIDLSDVLSAAASPNTQVDEVELMIAEASARARNTEDRIKMSSTLMYLIPQD